MIPVVPIMVGTTAALDLLKKAKEWFYPDKTINEAEAILRKRMADDVGSLQEQLQDHRQVIDKLVEQVKADKDMIQKHNEVLIQLSERAQQALVGMKRLRTLSYLAIGLAGLSALAAIVLAVLKRDSLVKIGRANRRDPSIAMFANAARVSGSKTMTTFEAVQDTKARCGVPAKATSAGPAKVLITAVTRKKL